MLRTLTIVGLLTLVIPRAEAHLWESIAQTEARYGRALEKFPGDAPGEEDRKYHYKDFYILVTFLDGRSDVEWYFHVDGKTPLSERDIQFFLSMTSDGKPWQNPSKLLWTLGGSNFESSKAVAAYFPKLPRTTIPGFGIYTITRAKKVMKIP